MRKIEKIREKIRESTLKTLKISKKQEERGLELHKKYIVFDSLLAAVPTPFSEKMIQKINEMIDRGISTDDIFRLSIDKMVLNEMSDPSVAQEIREEYIEAWRISGVTCASHTLPRSGNYTLLDIVKSTSIHNHKIEKIGDKIVKAICADDVKKAKKEGKHAILYNAQNIPHCIYGVDVESELDNLDTLFGLGIRVLQLTYQLRNVVGDGNAERYDSGLSHLGLRFIERMNKIGMLIDTSHCGCQTTLDAVVFSKDPIAATHTICQTIYGHPRGKTDEELKAIADKNGYVGICNVPPFLGGKGTIKELLDHIDYAIDLIGVDHVGIGTDVGYEILPRSLIERMEQEKKSPPKGSVFWRGFWPLDFDLLPGMSADETRDGSLAWLNWPYFTVGLVTRGYSDQEIRKIIGGNFLRIFEKVIG